jgi:GTP cyclohydrolase II
MTNHPRRVVGLEGYGIEIVEHIPISAADTYGFDSQEKDLIVASNLVGVCM